jgi:hypothetical protein
MLCKRCGQDFDRRDLKPPSLVLRLLAAPFLVFLMLKSGGIRGEMTGLYCRLCRRQINVSIVFIAFMVVVIGTVFLLQKLGSAGR